MRQYTILYKRGPGTKFAHLNPNDHAKLIDHEELRSAIKTMQQQPCIEGVCLRLEDELFNIMSFDQPAIAPDAFMFEEKP